MVTGSFSVQTMINFSKDVIRAFSMLGVADLIFQRKNKAMSGLHVLSSNTRLIMESECPHQDAFRVYFDFSGFFFVCVFFLRQKMFHLIRS